MKCIPCTFCLTPGQNSIMTLMSTPTAPISIFYPKKDREQIMLFASLIRNKKEKGEANFVREENVKKKSACEPLAVNLLR